ncbi:AP-3 complex subunit delta-1-like, partial [Diaphorina citri]|uniref:AP-3 complex subunit delta-1-like n=1 Tax=Diaphorina citri TaxID=121845 RepID=A0A3Q0JGU2_DIACI
MYVSRKVESEADRNILPATRGSSAAESGPRIDISEIAERSAAHRQLLMLTTNMIRKDLNAQNQYDAGLALSALACFTSTDLARDLANDIMMLLTSTKPYLRKKAVLMMYKVFLKFPDALRPAFPRLKEKLEDPDSGVQSAAVNVVCELARKNPKNYLSLAPVFFKLMTTSSNNWMLIKIIKLVCCSRFLLIFEEVLYAAAWICGEFREHLDSPRATLEAMTRRGLSLLPGHIQAVYVQNMLKILARILDSAESRDDAIE